MFFDNSSKQPFWNIYIGAAGRVASGTEPLANEANMADAPSVQDSIQSITITQRGKAGAGKSTSEAHITMEYGASDSSPPPFPFVDLAFPGTNPDNRMVIEIGYRGLIDPAEIEVVPVSWTESKGFVYDRYGIVKTNMATRAIVFAGKTDRPSMSGSNDGRLTLIAVAKSAADIHSKAGSAITLVEKAKRDYVVFDEEVVTKFASSIKSRINLYPAGDPTKVTGESIRSALLQIEKEVFQADPAVGKTVQFSTEALSRWKPVSLPDSLPKIVRYVSRLESKFEFLNRFCEYVGLTYLVVQARNGVEIVSFYQTVSGNSVDDNKELVRVAKDADESRKAADRAFESLKPYTGFSEHVPKNHSLILRYGIEVVSFNYQATNVPLVTRDPNTKEINSITKADSDGTLVTYKVDKAKIKAYFVKLRGSGVSNSAIASYIASWVKDDVDSFIATFTTMTPASGKKHYAKQEMYGKSGIVLSLNLKWAIPGMVPKKDFIVFAGADKVDKLIPDYVEGVYRLDELVYKLDATTDILTQTLKCRK